MKSVTDDVQALLEEYGDGPRRSCALLASELIAQIVGRERGLEDAVDLTIELRADEIRLQASGPASSPSDSSGSPERVADWGEFLLDRLADRWGMCEGPHRGIWAEVRV